jgi:ankyrin repeat protein
MKMLACALAALALAVPCLAQQRKAPAATIDLGVQQVEEGDFETAVATLDQALRGLGADAAHSRDRARAYLYMAIAYLGMSEEANAKARFLDALKQDHSLDLSPRQFSPRVLALFEQAKKEIAGGPSAARKLAPGTNPALFFLAVKNGDFTSVSQMLRESPGLVGERDAEFGASPLHWAARAGHEGIAGLLLAAGADQTLTNQDGETPLQVAQRSRRASIVRLLRAQEAPIYAAIQAGEVDAVRELLDKQPALLNRRDGEYGGAPLHWAAAKGQVAIVSLLLARGADAGATNRAGETPLQAARRVRHAGVIGLLAPVDVNLIAAVRSGDLEAAQQILARVPKLVNKPDATFGATPLHWAAIKGHGEMVSYLLSAGADPKATNSAGETPLQVAERAKRSEVVRILSELGAAGGSRPRP